MSCPEIPDKMIESMISEAGDLLIQTTYVYEVFNATLREFVRTGEDLVVMVDLLEKMQLLEAWSLNFGGKLIAIFDSAAFRTAAQASGLNTDQAAATDRMHTKHVMANRLLGELDPIPLELTAARTLLAGKLLTTAAWAATARQHFGNAINLLRQYQELLHLEIGD